MKYIDSEITTYWVHFQAGGIKEKLAYPRALVKCYHDDDFILQLTFYKDGVKIPENHYDAKARLVYLRYPMSMFPSLIDIMRNEKPIYFSYSVNSKRGYVRTGKEPVGEGEYDADFNS